MKKRPIIKPVGLRYPIKLFLGIGPIIERAFSFIGMIIQEVVTTISQNAVFIFHINNKL